MLRQVKTPAIPRLRLVTLALLALAAGCARVAERDAASASAPVGRAAEGAASPAAPAPPAPGTVPAPGAAPAARTTRILRIDRERSLLTIQAYRGGALAAAGHNHVIASHDLEGEVSFAEPLAASRLRLGFPVARLGIDEPALRARAGADFGAEVPDAAREGTRRNMLGGALLDGERFPQIGIESTSVAPAPGGVLLGLAIRVRDQVTNVELPVALEWRGAELVARGALELRQSQLGLVPFSVMMGALQVQDALRLQFEVVATP